MSSVPTQEVNLSIMVFHPEYGDDCEMELVFEVDLYYEGPDPSVGMSGGICPDGTSINKATISCWGRKAFEVTPELAEMLIPDDEYDRLEKQAEEDAMEQAYDIDDDY